MQSQRGAGSEVSKTVLCKACQGMGRVFREEVSSEPN
jgi:hypothetical protein